MGAAETQSQPAGSIDLELFREILLVPFSVDAAAGRTGGTTANRVDALRSMLREDPEKHWRRIDEPLLHLPEDEPANGMEGEQRARRLAGAYEEFVYFEPYVQDFLYGGASERPASKRPLEVWRAARMTELEIDYDLDQPPPDADRIGAASPNVATYRFRVTRCNFYLFSTGNAILVAELELEEKRRRGVVEPASLHDALSLLESVRRMFPPYFSREADRHGDPDAHLQAIYYPHRFRLTDSGSGEARNATHEIEPQAIIEKVVGPSTDARRFPMLVPLFEPWRRLLDPLVVRGYEAERPTAPAVVLTPLGDDRAFVVAQVGVADPLDISEGDWVRLCLLDSPGDGWPYARDFLEDFERDHCYDRFFSKTPHPLQTTRYLVCDYAMVCVGKALSSAAGDAATKDFFRHVIGRHLRRQYFQLVLIALLQRTALKTLSDRIADADAENATEVAAIQKEILDFTHRYWFEDISAQIQGRELFGLLRHHLRLRQLHGQLSQEIREANALAAQKAAQEEARKQSRLAGSAQRLNVIAAVGLAASVIVGFFGMNVFVEKPFMPADRDFVIGLALVMAVAFTALFGWRDRLMQSLSKGSVAYFALPFVALVVGFCLLLARFSGQ